MKYSDEHETDDFFRKGLENLSEEFPNHQDWKQMLPRLKKEGVIAEQKKRRGFFLIFPVAAALLASLFTFYFYENNNTPHSPAEKKEIAQGQQQKIQNTVPDKKEDAKEKQNTLVENVSEQTPSGSEKNVPEPVLLPQIPASQQVQQPLSELPVLKTDRKEEIPVAEKTTDIKEPKQEKTVQQNTTENSIVKNDEQPSAEIAVKETAPQSPPATPPSENTEKPIAAADTKDTIKSAEIKIDSAVVEIFAGAAIKDSSSKTTAMPAGENPESKTSKNTRRFYIGYYLSGDINHYELKDTRNTKFGESEYTLGQLKKNADTLKKQLQFTTGLIGGYSLSNYFSVEAGIFYSQKKKIQSTIYVPKYNTEYGESATDYTYYYNAQYLETYGRLKYYISKGKFNFYVAPGVLGSYNFPVNEDKKGYFTRSFYGESAMPQTEKIILQSGSLILSAVIAAGMEIRLSEKWGIYAEPSYKYALNPVIKYPSYGKIPVNHFWRTLSLGIGCMYHF